MKKVNLHLFRTLFAGSLVLTQIIHAVRCDAQPTPRQALLALSKADHTLAIVDPVALKVIARVPVGSDPHEVIASADGKTAYVSIYGGGSLHEINVIDLVGQNAYGLCNSGPEKSIYDQCFFWNGKYPGRYTHPARGICTTGSQTS